MAFLSDRSKGQDIEQSMIRNFEMPERLLVSCNHLVVSGINPYVSE